MRNLAVNSEKCCGCRICEMACSMTHLGTFNPRRGLLRVNINRSLSQDMKSSQIDVPVVCLQCDPAPCANACPEEAISKASFGAWVVDKEKCTSCSLCVEACPHGVIKVDAKDGIARKCNLCEGNPSCVEYCPMGALTF
jgi:Fe-S-cluster-containing hydrogenase component 2